MESLATEQLEDQLCDLIESNKLENKPYSGRNSYFIVKNEESTFPKEEAPILSPALTDSHVRIFKFQQ